MQMMIYGLLWSHINKPPGIYIYTISTPSYNVLSLSYLSLSIQIPPHFFEGLDDFQMTFFSTTMDGSPAVLTKRQKGGQGKTNEKAGDVKQILTVFSS